LFGNNDSPNNYPANTYHFRQDSCFLYYFGLKREGLAAVIDVDNDQEYVLGNDIEINDITWTGFVPSVADLAASAGVSNTAPMAQLKVMVDAAKAKGQTIHFLPQYRHDLMIQLSDLMGFHPLQTKEKASVKLIMAIVAMRSVKKPEEIENLFSLLKAVSKPETVEYFDDLYNRCQIRYGDLKKQLAEDMVAFVEPLRQRILEVGSDEEGLRRIIDRGKEKARASADRTIHEVRHVIGYRD
jgi:hypothetical protein